MPRTPATRQVTSKKTQPKRAVRRPSVKPRGKANATLFLSFWHVDFQNFTEGSFRCRQLTPAQARREIIAARKAGCLMGVTDKDLLAPYHKRERDSQLELCQVLTKHFQIPLSMNDFLNEFNDEGGTLYSINPLTLCQISGENRLLIVTCSYTFPNKKPHDGKGLVFAVASNTVKFFLFEAQ